MTISILIIDFRRQNFLPFMNFIVLLKVRSHKMTTNMPRKYERHSDVKI